MLVAFIRRVELFSNNLGSEIRFRGHFPFPVVPSVACAPCLSAIMENPFFPFTRVEMIVG